MLIDIQKWIIKKFTVKAKTAYRIVYYTYGFITFIPILAISYMFNIIPFTLVAFVVTGILRKYSYGLHMTNGKRIYLTIILLISLGILSKNIPLVYSFFIALWCVGDICFDWYTFTNSILCSLIMVDLTLFLNKSELG